MLFYNTQVGSAAMLTKGDVKIGVATRFGPNWPGKRCGAKTKSGTPCQRPSVSRTGRCYRHGGKKHRTEDRVWQGPPGGPAHEAWAVHEGKREAARASAEVGRQVSARIKLIELDLIAAGILDKHWRQRF